MAEAFVLGLLLLPQPNAGSLGIPIFPLNTVLWSLFFEVCANVVYALFARFMGLGVAIALSLLGLIGTVVIGPLGGGSIPDILWGIPRVAFGFFGGVALYLIWERGLTKRWPKLGLAWLSLPLLAITFVPYEIGGVWFILPAALFSAIILLGAHDHIGKLELRACIWLGALSYPFYLIHRPMLYFAPGIGKRFASMDGPAYHVAVVAALVGTVVFSHLAVRFYETPTRRWLTTALRRPQTARR